MYFASFIDWSKNNFSITQALWSVSGYFWGAYLPNGCQLDGINAKDYDKYKKLFIKHLIWLLIEQQS